MLWIVIDDVICVGVRKEIDPLAYLLVDFTCEDEVDKSRSTERSMENRVGERGESAPVVPCHA